MYGYQSLFILILFILASVFGDNRILQVFGNQSASIALALSMGILLLQTIAAPIQGGISDFYSRKKSLLVALSFSFLSIILLFFVTSQEALFVIFSIIVLLMNGALGNIVPLTWSALADTTQEKNLRFFLGLSSGAYAVGYMALAILNIHSIQKIESKSKLSLDDLAPTILFLCSILVCMLFFKDSRNKNIPAKERTNTFKLIRSEFKAILQDLTLVSTRWGLLAYFLWAVSQYSVLILITDFRTEHTFTLICMMLGYMLGIASLGFCKKFSDQNMIKTAFVISLSSFGLFFIVNPFIKNLYFAIAFCYFFYTAGNAFLTSSILALFSRDRTPDQQGKGFGLIISADSAGFLIATIVVLIFNSINLTTDKMIIFSFISFCISLYPYFKYERARKVNVHLPSLV